MPYACSVPSLRSYGCMLRAAPLHLPTSGPLACADLRASGATHYAGGRGPGDVRGPPFGAKLAVRRSKTPKIAQWFNYRNLKNF